MPRLEHAAHGRDPRRASRRALASLVAALVLGACGPSLVGSVPRHELRPIVERDAIVFEPGDLPDRLVTVLAAFDVILVGEFHGVAEHQALVGDVADALARHGLGAVLLEFPQAYSWLADAFAKGEDVGLSEGLDRTYGVLLRRIREVNGTLPPEDRISVAAIDVNDRSEAFLPPFRGLLHQLGRPTELLEVTAWYAQQRIDPAALLELAEALSSDEIAEAWGVGAQRIVLDMLHAEALSLDVRALPAGARRDALREEAMKELVERRLAAATGGVIINVGYFHAQKRAAFGTVGEWLGEYLHTTSLRARQSTYSLVVVPARGERDHRGELQSFDLRDTSPPNDLLLLLDAIAAGDVAFLSLDDGIFSKRVVTNYPGNLRADAPKAVFDGFVLLPVVGPASQYARP